MAGYDGYSMSNRARQAYSEGLLPASKMVTQLKKRYPRSFRGLTVAIFREVVGRGDEWHHTSAKYNQTEFYSMKSVYDCRAELKKAISHKSSTAQLFKKLEKAGRKYLITEGKVWLPADQLLRSPDTQSYRAAALAALELPEDLYSQAVAAYQAEMAAIVKARKERRT